MPNLNSFRAAVAGVVLTIALLSGAGVAHAAPVASPTVRSEIGTHALASSSKPVIKGKHKVGSRLGASFRAWQSGSMTLRYVWKRGGDAISGANHRTYTVRKADRGHRLTVTVVGTKADFSTVKRTSASIAIPRAAKEKSKSSSCDPNYSPCVPIAYDVDCAGGSGNGPAYVQGPVRVTGRDIYGLDYDGDGVGCE